jgi:hypothetical protein
MLTATYEGNLSLGRNREDNIKMDLRKNRRKAVNQIDKIRIGPNNGLW